MKLKLFSVLVGGVLALNAGAVLAQAKPAAAATDEMQMVNKLIALGDARKDPILLLAAASLQKSMGEGTTLPAKGMGVDDVLTRAKSFAVGRPDRIGVADELATVKPKAQWRIDAVSGRSTYRN